jgi:hypothetical protein
LATWNTLKSHIKASYDVDADEFQIPLLMVSRAADALEKELRGTDEQ